MQNVYRLGQPHHTAPTFHRPRPAFDRARFNQAAKAFFETWRPAATRRGTLAVPSILVRFSFSASGLLVAHYADPLHRSVAVWGLDVPSFLQGRLVARRLAN